MKLHLSSKNLINIFSLKNFAPYILLFGLSVLAASCAKDPIPAPKPVITPEYSFDTDLNSSLLFQDGSDVFGLVKTPAKPDGTGFEIGKVLQVKAINQTSIQIINFVPADIEDATILMTIKGLPKPIQLFKIKRIRAHASQTIQYPFINGETNFLDVDGATVSLEKYKPNGINPSEVSFDFTGKTPLITKLKSLAKLKWIIEFKSLYNFDPENWVFNPPAKDARRFIGLMINMAYLFQKEEMKTAFLNEDITGNGGVTFLTKAQKENDYKKLFNIPLIYCDVSSYYIGYAGAAGTASYYLSTDVYGIHDTPLSQYIDSDQSYVTVHEFGHILGYDHSSSMTYAQNGKGFVHAAEAISAKLIKEKDYPITLDNYYKPSDFKR